MTTLSQEYLVACDVRGAMLVSSPPTIISIDPLRKRPVWSNNTSLITVSSPDDNALNSFTPKSDQFEISPAVTRNIYSNVTQYEELDFS